MKRVSWNVIIFSMVFIFILFFIGVNLTGNVVWGNIRFSNCTDSEIESMWDGVFLKDSSEGLNIEKNNNINGYCEEFLAYNITEETELRLLYVNIWNNSWNETEKFGIYNNPNSRVLESFDSNVIYVNTTEEFLIFFESLPTISEKYLAVYNLISDYDNTTDWNLIDYDNMIGNLSGIFETSVVEDDDWNSEADSWTLNEQEFFNWYNYSKNFNFVSHDESFIHLNNSIKYFDPDFYVKNLSDIPDFDFLPNSNWSFAFNISDYFNISNIFVDNNVSINFSADTNNSDGEWINASIGSFGNVSFFPAENFTGTRQFELKIVSISGVNTSSNIFNITINSPPVCLEIDDFIIVNGTSQSIDLDDYCSDADGESLTYTIFRGEVGTVDVGISGSELTIGLLRNFGSYDSFKINVADRFTSIQTNKIYIYEPSSFTGVNDGNNNGGDDNGGVIGDGNNNGGDNDELNKIISSSGNIKKIDNPNSSNNLIKIVLWSFLSIIISAVLIILITIIMKFIKNKKFKNNFNQNKMPNYTPTIRNNKPQLQQRFLPRQSSQIPKRNNQVRRNPDFNNRVNNFRRK